MSSIAQQLVGSALQASQESPDIAGSIQSGAELARGLEQLKIQRQQMEQAKQNQSLAILDKVGNWMTSYNKMKEGPAKEAFRNEFFPKGVVAIGADKVINPAVLNIMQKDMNAGAYLAALQIRGKVSYEELVKGLADEEAFYALLEEKGYNNFESPEALKAAIQGSLDTFASIEAKNIEREQELADQKAATEEARRAAQLTREFEQLKRAEDKAKFLGEKFVKDGVDTLEDTIDDIEDKTFSGNLNRPPKGPIPGFGNKDGNIPLGRLSGPAAENRRLAFRLVNSIIKATTGAQVSENEATRIAGQLGFTLAPTEGGGFTAVFNGQTSGNAFRQGVLDSLDTLKSIKANYRAAAGPEAYELFRKRKDYYLGQVEQERAERRTEKNVLAKVGTQITPQMKKTYKSSSAEGKEFFIDTLSNKLGISPGNRGEIRKLLEN